MPPMPDLRRLEIQHIPAAAALAGRAFRDVPGYVAVLDRHTEEQRLAAVTRVKRGICEGYVRYADGHGLWEGDRLIGVTLSAPPGRYPPGLRADAYLYGYALTLGPRSILRLLHIARYMDEHHVKERHYYLMVIAIEPELWGRGHGKIMLRAIHDRADALRAPCYLETDKPSNVKLYRSVGYEILHEGTIEPLGGLRMWAMRREPR